MVYYGTRLSENLSIRKPEGYLFCLNVPVARTGVQEYLPEELGLPSGSGMIPVQRPEEEVFSPETMASFEGMPVTDDHPTAGVDLDNIKALHRGHASNIRRGSGEESDLLLADLVIQDARLIDEIMNQGKREISCGYTYQLSEENGQYVQRQIRGNHVAVVDAGRAGPRVCIKDKAPKIERRKSMKKSLYKKLVRMARDGDAEAIEAVAEIVENLTDPEVVEVVEPVAVPVAPVAAEPAAAAPAAVEDPAVVVETPEGTEIVADEVTLADIAAKLDQLIGILSPAATEATADEDPVEEIAEAVEEALEAAETAEEVPAEVPEAAAEIAELVEEIVDPAAAVAEVLEPVTDCDDPQQCNASNDALRSALRAVRPALAKMPRKQRRKVAADIAARMKKAQRTNDAAYAALKSRMKAAAPADPGELGRRIMAARNINHKK